MYSFPYSREMVIVVFGDKIQMVYEFASAFSSAWHKFALSLFFPLMCVKPAGKTSPRRSLRFSFFNQPC
jgi:hypothetical protein